MDKPKSRLKYACNLLSVTIKAIAQKVRVNQNQAPAILIFGLILEKKKKFLKVLGLDHDGKTLRQRARKDDTFRGFSVRCLKLSRFEETKKKSRREATLKQSNLIENLSLRVRFKSYNRCRFNLSWTLWIFWLSVAFSWHQDCKCLKIPQKPSCLDFLVQEMSILPDLENKF